MEKTELKQGILGNIAMDLAVRVGRHFDRVTPFVQAELVEDEQGKTQPQVILVWSMKTTSSSPVSANLKLMVTGGGKMAVKIHAHRLQKKDDASDRDRPHLFERVVDCVATLMGSGQGVHVPSDYMSLVAKQVACLFE